MFHDVPQDWFRLRVCFFGYARTQPASMTTSIVLSAYFVRWENLRIHSRYGNRERGSKLRGLNCDE